MNIDINEVNKFISECKLAGGDLTSFKKDVVATGQHLTIYSTLYEYGTLKKYNYSFQAYVLKTEAYKMIASALNHRVNPEWRYNGRV